MEMTNILELLASASALKHDAVKLWMAIPFVLLLVLIAIAPLAGTKLKHFWEKRYPVVAIALGAIVSAYYIWLVPGGAHDVWHSFKEYLSFIVLVGSLYVISGGISIRIEGEATPKKNVVFLLMGALLANLIGTTGASMVLIRPWMRMNKFRLSAHHIVFFIFVVSNVGGALTPIGDPPLYIGYLRGIDFFWVFEHASLPWAFVVAALLGVFYLLDVRSFRKAGTRGRIAEHSAERMTFSASEMIYLRDVRSFRKAGTRGCLAEHSAERMTFSASGMKNIVYLMVVVCAVFLPGQVSPSMREIIETYFIREIVMVVAAVASFFKTHPRIHEENNFSFEPIREVGFLFFGIFLTMVPALAYLTSHGAEIGAALTHPAQYFFAAGSLSGFLDNTPTYANFFDLIRGLAENDPASAGTANIVAWMTDSSNHAYNLLIVAISLGSVFFGALTYIGNGPNFMVKSIAEAEKVKMPSFFGYMLRYGLPILVPVLCLCALIFLRSEDAPADTVPASVAEAPAVPAK